MNTEIPDFNRDDIATPRALEEWLAGTGLIAPGDAVDGDVFVAARALRAALREPRARQHPRRAARRRAAHRDRVRSKPSRSSSGGHGGPGFAPTGRAPGAASRRCSPWWPRRAREGRGSASRRAGRRRCGWLFYDGRATALQLVLHGGVCGAARRRRPTGTAVPGAGRMMRSAVYVVSLAVRRLRRRDGGALLPRSVSRPPARCSQGSWWARPSRRTEASRRTSSGSPRPRAPCGLPGSASPRDGRRRGRHSIARLVMRSRRCRRVRRSRSSSSARAPSAVRSSVSRPSTGSRRTW